jgi:hypothetical protein
MKKISGFFKRAICYILGGHRYDELRGLSVNFDDGSQFKMRIFSCKRCKHSFSQSTNKTWPAMGRRF